MQYEGVLTKMLTEFGKPIQYYLTIGGSFLNMNQLLGREVLLQWLAYKCLSCEKNKKIWRQGFCYDCFSSNPAAGQWIIQPELSTAHLGIADRDLAYESQAQLQPHIVYLALCSDVKVGVTKKSQVPTRWIDQGASKALQVIEVPNRYLAGISEVALKEFYTDKTNWKKMLLNEQLAADLTIEYRKAVSHLPSEVQPYLSDDTPEIIELQYPLLSIPAKVNTLYLDKTQHYSGLLIGIRGQYLIFDDGVVFNIRNAEGNVVSINTGKNL
jgi:hypothetical protein